MWIRIVSEEAPHGMLVHFKDEDLGRIYIKELQHNALDSERFRLHIECKDRETFTVDGDKEYIMELYGYICDYISDIHEDEIVDFESDEAFESDDDDDDDYSEMELL
jgi:hypothetical protein